MQDMSHMLLFNTHTWFPLIEYHFKKLFTLKKSKVNIFAVCKHFQTFVVFRLFGFLCCDFSFFQVITVLNVGQVTCVQCWYASPLTKLNSLIIFISKALWKCVSCLWVATFRELNMCCRKERRLGVGGNPYKAKELSMCKALYKEKGRSAVWKYWG